MSDEAFSVSGTEAGDAEPELERNVKVLVIGDYAVGLCTRRGTLASPPPPSQLH